MRAHRARHALPVGRLDEMLPLAIPVPYPQLLRSKRRWIIEPKNFELRR